MVYFDFSYLIWLVYVILLKLQICLNTVVNELYVKGFSKYFRFDT